MTVWQPPEYSCPADTTSLTMCEQCGVPVVDQTKHTRWHFRDSVRGRDSCGCDLRITEQQVKDYGYDG